LTTLGASLAMRSFARIASGVSVLGVTLVGASLSVRGLARVGSSLSVMGVARFGSLFSLSVFDFFHLGAAMALRSFARFGSSLSVCQFASLGSSVSLRRFARIGSAVSVLGMARFGSLFSLALCDVASLGSSLSIRTLSRIGASLSVLDFFHLGSALAVRSMARLGATLSLMGSTHLGSSLSVLDFVNLGSSVSIRGIVRCGGELSVSSNIRVGSNAITFANTVAGSATYVREASNTLEFYVQGSRSVTMESDGGILHGSWTMESTAVTSDRRMKKDIAPLQRTLRAVLASKEAPESEALPDPSSGSSEESSDGALWLLRQLRPVSYSFRKGAESKFMRFGFIADELESVVPNVVRTGKGKAFADQKAVQYQDLIALLAAAAQSQQQRIDEMQQEMEEMHAELKGLQQALKAPLPDEDASELNEKEEQTGGHEQWSWWA